MVTLVNIAINTEKLVEIYDIESINMNISLSSETKIDNFEEAPNYEISTKGNVRNIFKSFINKIISMFFNLIHSFIFYIYKIFFF